MKKSLLVESFYKLESKLVSCAVLNCVLLVDARIKLQTLKRSFRE